MATDAANLDSAIKTAGAFVGGGLALAGGAVGAAIGDGMAGSADLRRCPPARSPDATHPVFFLTVGLVEAVYFINLVFMTMFVFVLGK